LSRISLALIRATCCEEVHSLAKEALEAKETQTGALLAIEEARHLTGFFLVDLGFRPLIRVTLLTFISSCGFGGIRSRAPIIFAALSTSRSL
jgi:hypothetical protein